MRQIDADELKAKLSNLEARGGHEYYLQGMNDVLHKFMPIIIDEQPTVEQPRWIPVTERLPEVVKTKRVHRNVYRESGRVLCACLQADGKRLVKEGYMFFFNDNPQPKWAIPGTIHSVTHWQPLPEPPTPEECSAVGEED